MQIQARGGSALSRRFDTRSTSPCMNLGEPFTNCFELAETPQRKYFSSVRIFLYYQSQSFPSFMDWLFAVRRTCRTNELSSEPVRGDDYERFPEHKNQLVNRTEKTSKS